MCLPICFSRFAFSVLGAPQRGGDASGVQAQLDLGVEQVWSTNASFFAQLSNGKGVAWGDPIYGGDMSKVQAQD